VGISDKISERIADALLEVEKHTAEVAVGLAKWRNGQMLTGARALNAADHARRWGGSGRLLGWSVKATGGAVQTLIRDGRASGDGDIIAIIDLVDGESETIPLGPDGISFGEGLYLDKTGAGSLIGAVWIE